MAYYLDNGSELDIAISRLIIIATRMSRHDEDGVSESKRTRDATELCALVEKIVAEALKLAGISIDGQDGGLLENTRVNNIVIDDYGGIEINRITSSGPCREISYTAPVIEREMWAKHIPPAVEKVSGSSQPYYEKVVSTYTPSSCRLNLESDDGAHINFYENVGPATKKLTGTKRSRSDGKAVPAYRSPSRRQVNIKPESVKPGSGNRSGYTQPCSTEKVVPASKFASYNLPEAQVMLPRGTSTRKKLKYTTATNAPTTHEYTNIHGKNRTNGHVY